MAENAKDTLIHILVLGLLLIVLLVVVTKFKWISCTDVPGWCDVYCSFNGNSKVAFVTGSGAIGNAATLAPLIQRSRPYTVMEVVPASQLSAGWLDGYELVVVEGAKNVSQAQLNALLDYLDKGGSLVLVGDAFSQIVLTPGDLEEALVLNETIPGAYEQIVKENQRQGKGWGELGTYYVGAEYLRTETPKPATFKVLIRDNPLTAGLKTEYLLGNLSGAPLPVPFAVANPQADRVSRIADLVVDGRAYPAILERKYAGRIVWIAFPPENSGSRTLIGNLFDHLVEC